MPGSPDAPHVTPGGSGQGDSPIKTPAGGGKGNANPGGQGESNTEAPPGGGKGQGPADPTQFPQEDGKPSAGDGPPQPHGPSNEEPDLDSKEPDQGGAAPHDYPKDKKDDPSDDSKSDSGSGSDGDGEGDGQDEQENEKSDDEKSESSKGMAILGGLPVACIGAMTAHGSPLGSPAAGTKTIRVNGVPVFRCLIDQHIDGDGSGIVAISISGQLNVLWEGAPAAVKGDVIQEASLLGPNEILPGGAGAAGPPVKGGIGDAISDFFGALIHGDLDAIQTALSALGVLDPTPFTDGLNSIISLGRGNYIDAMINAVAMVPYIGDIAKGAKVVGKEAMAAEHLAQAAAKADAHAAEEAAKAAKLEQEAAAHAEQSVAKGESEATGGGKGGPDENPGSQASNPSVTATASHQIADGHAYSKHIKEFDDLGIHTKDEFAKHIENVIDGAGPADSKQLARGRTAYYDDATNTVVIRDPSSPDGGTAFRPRKGRAYFDDLK